MMYFNTSPNKLSLAERTATVAFPTDPIQCSYMSTCISCHKPNEHCLPCCSAKTGLCASCQTQPDPSTGLLTCLMCGLKYNGRDFSVPVAVSGSNKSSSSPIEIASTCSSSRLSKHDSFNQSPYSVDNQTEIDWLKDKNLALSQAVACITKEKDCLSSSLIRREKTISSLTEQLRQSTLAPNDVDQEIISGLREQCQALLAERQQLYQQLLEVTHMQKTIGSLKLQISQKEDEIRELRKGVATSRPTPVIGIDIGTTKSCVAFLDKHGKLQTIVNERGESLFPSSVNLFGVDQENSKQSNVVSCIKRLLSLSYDDAVKQAKRLSWQFTVTEGKRDFCSTEIVVPCRPNETFTPLELCAILLMKLKHQAERYFGDQKITDAVIVVPAHFGDAQRQAVIDAASVAGLNVWRLVSETSAVMAVYENRVLNSDEILKPDSLLVVAMGGGVTESAFFKYNNVASSYEMDCCHSSSIGGEDIDSLLMQCCRSEWKNHLIGDEILSEIKQKCQQAKEQLSSGSKQAEIQVNLKNYTNLSLTVTKTRFDGLVSGFVLPEFKKLISKAVNGHSPREIILSGGSMQIPALIHAVHGMFPEAGISQLVNYGEAVAHGAALYGTSLARHLPHVPAVIPLELDCFVKHSDPENKKSHCWRIAECVSLPCVAKFPHSWPLEILDENAVNFTLTVRQNKKTVGSARFKDGKLSDFELIVEIDENGILTDLRANFLADSETAISVEKENDGLTKNQNRKITARLQRMQQEEKQPVSAEKDNRNKLEKLAAFFEDQTFVSNINAQIG